MYSIGLNSLSTVTWLGVLSDSDSGTVLQSSTTSISRRPPIVHRDYYELGFCCREIIEYNELLNERAIDEKRVVR